MRLIKDLVSREAICGSTRHSATSAKHMRPDTNEAGGESLARRGGGGLGGRDVLRRFRIQPFCRGSGVVEIWNAEEFELGFNNYLLMSLGLLIVRCIFGKV